jgi:heptosyltransferase-3
MSVPSTVILSRPDALGDAVVTMTTAGWVKKHAPSSRLVVLAKEYTRAVWERCAHVDRVITLEELEHMGEGIAALELATLRADAIVHLFPHRDVARWAKEAGIPRRIGTSHRWWHWYTCNERVNFSRKRSDLHEAQLNIKLLEPFGLPMPGRIDELVPHIGYTPPQPSSAVRALLRPGVKNVVLHPLLGSGVGWGLENFANLIRALDPLRYHCLITGTPEEAERYREQLPLDADHVTDTGGTLDLERLMQLIGACDAFVSASTGPLHLAAASGVRSIGLFSMRRPILPARWAPIGRDAHALVFDPACSRCASGRSCDCIQRISPVRVIGLLER